MFKLYPSWFLFFLVILLGVSFVVSGDNWFMVWVGFELSVLGFMPLFSVGVFSIEGVLKYFLVQAAGSGLFLFSFIAGDLGGGIFTVVAMVLKLGVFPFYHWVPSVMMSLSWGGCLVLSTVQKVGPLFVLFAQRESFFNLVVVLGGVSVVVSSLLGFNQTYMRSLMGYSSIGHSGWLVCLSVVDLGLMVLYFFLYSLLLFSLFNLFRLYNVYEIISGGYSFSVFYLISFLLLSLSGIPPFSVFFMKVVVLYYLVGFSGWSLFFVLGAILSVYYYLIFVIPNLMTVDYCSYSIIFPKSFSFLGFIGSFLFPLVFLF